MANTPRLSYVPLEEIRRVRTEVKSSRQGDAFALQKILADIFRLNVLYMIMRAGSGHIGTSFSAMDIMTLLWTSIMKNPNEKNSSEISDTFFSSKGHDVPALYSILIGLEKIDFNLIHSLRQLNGLPGHPDIGTPYIAANTGSLGMGISKARGMVLANRLQGKSGKFYVLTGDGELQEGQIWESLQPAANQGLWEITVIVDHNKMQSDSWVEQVSNLGPLEEKFKTFGWYADRCCDGHDFEALKRTISLAQAAGKTLKKPQVIIADTIKGKGVSFMESTAFVGKESYKFHAGAPSLEDYLNAVAELYNTINADLAALGISSLSLERADLPQRALPKNPQKLVSAYGDELLKISRERKDIVVLDADLLADCGIREFKKEFPDRFFECGIAEQDMVSVAGGMALRGLLPVAHSFACFLSTRPNEQIYNNASEKTKIIYTGTLAGILPAAPGHSHQSVRDISALGAIPGLIMIEPCNEEEARMAIRWAVEKNKQSTYIRLVNIPCELPYALPSHYYLREGYGVTIKEGKNAALIAYGPIMLKETLKARELLAKNYETDLAVINLPWLNRVDFQWLTSLAHFPVIFTLDDHYLTFGQGSLITQEFARYMKRPKIITLGLHEFPVCGENDRALQWHCLDAVSIANTILVKL